MSTAPSPADHPAAATVDWARLRSTQFDRASAAATVAVLPIGSTEQHGPHLPVEVDSLLVTEVARRSAVQLAGRVPVLVLPTLWVSLAEHHMDLAGSLTLDFDTLLAFVRCTVRSLQRQGFERILLLNGHGGNMTALPLIVDQLTQQLGLPLATATYFLLAAPAFANILEGQPNLLHACEAETSMVLHLRPELVDMAAARQLAAPARGLLQTPGTHRWRNMAYWSCSGVVGSPQLATADKGQRLLQAAVDAVAGAIAGGSLWEDG